MCRAALLIYINNMNINDMFISEDGMGHFDGNGSN